MSKKILIVGQHFWPESFRINDIADFLVNEKKCEVDVLCGLPNYPSGKFPEGYGYFKNRKQTYKGVNIRRVFEITRGNNSNSRILLNYISFPIASLFHIPRLLFKKYDKIFLYQLSPVAMSLAGIIVGKIKKTETVMYVLDLWPENFFSVVPIKNKFLRSFLTRMSHWHYKKVDKIIVLSEQMKAQIKHVTKISEDKIIILPQASEKIYETSIHDKALHERFQGKFNVVFTGSITPAQSFDTIIKAAAILRKSSDTINWIIVGDGMSRQQVEKSVSDAGLSDIFFFEGQKPIEKIPAYTNIANVLVGCLVKSDLLEATIPAKVLSYIASGKPIVLAMDGEVQTLISDTIRGGFVGPTEDHTALANNIERLRTMPQQEYDAMQVRLRTYHSQHFERKLLLNKLYDFVFST